MNNPRTHVGLLLLMAATMFAPYAVAGPGIFRDDWFTLRNAEFDGWWMSAGSSQWFARPAGSAIYALTFGVVGQRPTIHFALAAVVVTATSVVIYRVARRHMPALAALGVAGIWLILPNHTSLEMWPSAFNIAVALFLLLLGVDVLERGPMSWRRSCAAAALLSIGLLSYEAIGPAAVVAVLLIAWTRERDQRLLTALPSLLSLGVAGLWMILNWHPEKKELEAAMDPSLVIPGHFGLTVTGGVRAAEILVPTAVLVVSVVGAYRLILHERRSQTGWEERTVLAGWTLMLLGVLPFVRYFYAPIGFGDRVTVVSGIGGALVLVGAIGLLARWWRPAAALLAIVVIGTAIPQRASLVSDYATAADDSRRILDAIESRWPTPPAGQMVFGPSPIVERHVLAFEDMDPPLQILYGDRTFDTTFTSDEEEFFDAPSSLRMDLRPLSNLDDGRLDDP